MMRYALLAVVCLTPAFGIEAVDPTLQSLRLVVEPLEDSLRDVEALKAELAAAEGEDGKREIQKKIESERARIEQLRGHFRDIVGGAEAAGYDVAEPEKRSVQEQIGDVLDPLLGELREATALPREIDALRDDLATWRERKERAGAVIERSDLIAAAADDGTLLAELSATRRLWTDRLADATGRIGVIEVRLAELESRKKPIWDTFSDAFGRFFRSRGLNLLLAAVAALVGFVAVRRLYRVIRRVSPAHRGKPALSARIADVVAAAAAVLVAVAGVLLVFYLRGDWMMLSLAVILVVGAAWAGKTALPPYFEQIRMILNLGPVREGERLVLRGLPWRVETLGFLTVLRNPALQGGELRVPVRQLLEMVSRDPAEREPWFPTAPDEWVLLEDGTYGKTVVQTPENVVVLQLGGSRKTYPTEAFLEQHPENLSHGFRVTVEFGIDYSHQAIAVDEVPTILTRHLTERLGADFGRDSVRSVQVEFARAAASSLDYAILADFDGSLASKLGPIRRRIQQCLVSACNEHGWTIPFTQVTVHRAAADTDVLSG